MSIVVERDTLLPMLSAAVRTMEKGLQIPILKNVMLRPSSNCLEVIGTNLDRRLEACVAARLERELAPTTVDGESFLRILSGLADGSHVSLDWEATHMELRSGRSRYRLQTLPATDFPESRPMSEPLEFSISGSDLGTALRLVKPFARPDKARNYLASVFLHIDTDAHEAFGGGSAERLVFVSTTSIEFARYSMPLPVGAALPQQPNSRWQGLLIPEAMVAEIIRFASGGGEIVISAAPNLIAFRRGRDVFSTVLLDATYPDYVRPMPVASYSQITIDADEASAALRRICSIGDDTRTRFTVDAAGIHLSLVNRSTTSAGEEFIEAELTGAGFTLGLRPGGLLALLEGLNCDTAVIRVNPERQGILVNALIEGEIDYHRTMLTMPIDIGAQP